ncbi:MAG: hypothetical protein DRJ20_01215 [Candidatus Methanomethylicota archaeon]|uniref:Uncharacterized protein n=1 Tax=Thermoproteota archaeon TaxID=2056631 RepID=A0A497EXP7_9CREN|nr:MAG: hypothetical protein DRJ20_01215 [Candidatus Verstraetearchaeota archaeon]
MVVVPRMLGIVNLASIISSLHASKCILGTFGPISERVKINASILDALGWEKTIVIDGFGEYSALCSLCRDCKLVRLGFNASISPFNLSWFDPYIRAFEISEAFKLSFHISEVSARILQQALARFVARGVYEPSVEDVILEIESQSQIASTRPYSFRLLRLLDNLTWGRIGSSFSGFLGLDDVGNSLLIVDLHHLPREFRVLASILLFLNFSERSDVKLVLEESDLLMPGLMRALREEYAVAFERTLFILDILKRSRNPAIILSCRSPMLLAFRARLSLNCAFSSPPRSKEEFNALSALLPLADFRLEHVNYIPSSAFLVFYGGRVSIAELKFKELPEVRIPVEDVIKPTKPKVESALHKMFRGLADPAAQILSFLLQGAADRDTLMGYAVGVLGLSSEVAQRIISVLSAYGFIADVVGRDGKYYLRITPSGIAALNEYSSYRGDGDE